MKNYSAHIHQKDMRHFHAQNCLIEKKKLLFFDKRQKNFIEQKVHFFSLEYYAHRKLFIT